MATEAVGTEDACKGRDICAHRHMLHVRKHASSRTVISLAVSEVGYRMWNPHSFWNPQSRENLFHTLSHTQTRSTQRFAPLLGLLLLRLLLAFGRRAGGRHRHRHLGRLGCGSLVEIWEDMEKYEEKYGKYIF